MSPRFSMLLLVSLLTACATWESTGDDLMGVGDYDRAAKAYDRAILEAPSDTEVFEKRAEARRRATAARLKTARGCDDRDLKSPASPELLLTCAEGALGPVLAWNPDDEKALAILADFHLEAARRYAQRLVSESDPALARRLDQSLTFAARHGKTEASDALRASVVDRTRQQTAQSLDRWYVGAPGAGRQLVGLARTLEVLAIVGGPAAAAELEPRLTEARAVHNAIRLGELEQNLAAGHFHLARIAFLDAALTGPVPEGEGPYLEALDTGEQAVKARRWDTAIRAFESAAAMANDTRDFAARAADAARPRTVRIHFRDLLVSPTAPDGKAWTGAEDTNLAGLGATIAGAVVGELAGSTAGMLTGRALDLVSKVPEKSRPNLRLSVRLPDGRSFVTETRTGVYVDADAGVILETNAHDVRRLEVRVEHLPGLGRDPRTVGTVALRLSELLAGRGPTPTGGLLHLGVTVDPAPDRTDGEVDGLTPVPTDDNEAETLSAAGRDRRGIQLLRVRAHATPENETTAGGGLEGKPDLAVAVSIAGATVYRSPTRDDVLEADWSPTTCYLFARDDDAVEIRLLDTDPVGGDDTLGTWKTTGAELAGVDGDLEVGTVTLTLRPRPVGP